MFLFTQCQTSWYLDSQHFSFNGLHFPGTTGASHGPIPKHTPDLMLNGTWALATPHLVWIKCAVPCCRLCKFSPFFLWDSFWSRISSGLWKCTISFLTGKSQRVLWNSSQAVRLWHPPLMNEGIPAQEGGLPRRSHNPSPPTLLFPKCAVLRRSQIALRI